MTYVNIIKVLPTGYVRLGVRGRRAWAQMPRNVWESLQPGDVIPGEYQFEPHESMLLKAEAEFAKLVDVKEVENGNAK